MNGTILVVEDDLAIRQGLVDVLRGRGYRPLAAGDGAQGLTHAREHEVDLVLLDLVLPDQNGLAVLAALREWDATLPVIIVTACGDHTQRVAGLDAGADDYVVKPFDAGEVMARVEAVLRRSSERPQPLTRLRLAGGEVDFTRGKVCFDDGTHAELPALEAALLRYLAERPERVVSRQELLQRVWRFQGHRLLTRSVDMTVARLRRRLRFGAADSRRAGGVTTVRGQGYRFEPFDEPLGEPEP